VYIWCDWNRNGTLTDAGEAVFASAAGVGPFTTNITPPAGTTVGPVRMRIRLTDSGSGPNTTPCGNSTYGEVEDYTLNVSLTLAPIVVDNGSGEAAGGRGLDAVGAMPRADELLVYPNPTRGECTIKASSPGTYYLMNEMGDLVRSFTLNSDNNQTIQLRDLNTGMYILSGQTRTGIVKQKIVVTD
jgi:GEVED domain/Secretion system C-terminal sorting domain